MKQLSVEAIQLAVETAFSQLRDGSWLALATSPLAHGQLAQSYFLADEPVTDDVRARAVTVLLAWATRRLQPSGSHDWFSNSWRYYNLIYHFYLEGWRVADLAARMGITEQTFYNWRPQALQAVGRIVQGEYEDPRDFEGRRQAAIASRIDALAPDARRLAFALAVYEPGQSALPAWLARMQPGVDLAQLHQLQVLWLIALSDGNGVQLQADVLPYIYLLLPEAERCRLHREAGALYLQAQRYVEAAYQLHAGGASAQAAQLIVDEQQAIFDRAHVEPLQSLLRLLQPADLQRRSDLWAELQIVSGRVAEYLHDLDRALAAYGEALNAAGLGVRARAYQLRARLLQRIDLDQSLTHYAVCIDLLERKRRREGVLPAELAELLTEIIISRAWIYIQDRPDFERATAALEHAEQIAPEDDSLIWSQLYNAWAGLAYQQQRLHDALEFRLKAWVAACAAQNAAEMMKTAFNLGQGYLWLDQAQKALDYFAKAADLADDSGNVQMQGLIEKGVGSTHFLQGNAERAIVHYEKAYATWKTTKNSNYLINSCYDLAEAHAALLQWEQARRYYDEGIELARTLEHARYLAEFADLAERLPPLTLMLNGDQQLALQYVYHHGEITSGEFVALTGLSKRKALANLKALVEQGVLIRLGKGRSVRYRSPAALP